MTPVSLAGPSYLRAAEEGTLEARVGEARAMLDPCRVCPRPCRGVNRLADEIGGCRIGRRARVTAAYPHLGEEDVLRGKRGSGTIFFGGCNLRCVFCQNWEISQRPAGREVDAVELAEVMVRLQDAGCHNINLVTPEHVVPQIIEALPHAIRLGLRLPLVYNTSAYDSLGGLRLLDGVVDVYMPDFKLWDPDRCRRYLGARDYAEVARASIMEMHRQVGDLILDEHGLAVRGLLVRHLVLPGMVEDTFSVLDFVAGLSTDTFVNLMGQYRPAWKAASDPRYAEIDRQISPSEMWQAFQHAADVGLWRFDTRWPE